MSLRPKVDIHSLLKDSPGLLLPQTRTRMPDGSFLVVDNPGVISHESVRRFLCLGSPNYQWWYGPHVYHRLCEIFERTQDRAQAHLDGSLKDDDSIVPLSTSHWRDVQYQMSYGTKSQDECRLEKVLDPFVRLVLRLRRDWMMHHHGSWLDPPSDVLVARIHSCLMVLKRMHMRSRDLTDKRQRFAPSLLPLSVLGDRWLAFDISEFDIDRAVGACQRAFPRETSF